jgi:hypothetical protein
MIRDACDCRKGYHFFSVIGYKLSRLRSFLPSIFCLLMKVYLRFPSLVTERRRSPIFPGRKIRGRPWTRDGNSCSVEDRWEHLITTCVGMEKGREMRMTKADPSADNNLPDEQVRPRRPQLSFWIDSTYSLHDFDTSKHANPFAMHPNLKCKTSALYTLPHTSSTRNLNRNSSHNKLIEYQILNTP